MVDYGGFIRNGAAETGRIVLFGKRKQNVEQLPSPCLQYARLPIDFAERNALVTVIFAQAPGDGLDEFDEVDALAKMETRRNHADKKPDGLFEGRRIAIEGGQADDAFVPILNPGKTEVRDFVTVWA